MSKPISKAKPISKPISKAKPKAIRKSRIGGGVLPQLKDINESELAILCHCSILKYPELKESNQIIMLIQKVIIY